MRTARRLLALWLLLVPLFVGHAGIITETGPRHVVTPSTTSYSTAFPSTENPISQGALWQNGQADGTVFKNVQTITGLAFATGTNTSYDDSLAALTGTYCGGSGHADQYIEGVVHKASGYTPPDSQEIELLLRVTFNGAGPFYAPLYEIDYGWATDVAVIRQDGTVGGYTVLSGSGPGMGRAAADGDVMRAKIVGSVITVYLNGVQVYTVTDPTITSGHTGIGFFVRPGGGVNLQAFGWSSINCGPAT